MSLSMTSDRRGTTESGRDVSIGTTVEYMGHICGGAIKVRMPDGAVDVMSPLCFAQLRTK